MTSTDGPPPTRDPLTLLAAHASHLDSLSTTDRVLTATVEAVPDLLDAHASALVAINGDMASFRNQHGLDGPSAAAWRCPVAGLAARRAVTERMSCSGSQPAFTDHRRIDGMAAVDQWCAVPLVVDDRVDFVLFALRRDGRTFGAAEQTMLTLLGGQAAAAVARTQAVTAIEQRRRAVERMRELCRGLASTLDLTQVLQRACAGVREVTPADRVTVLLCDPAGLHLRPATAGSPGLGEQVLADSPLLSRALAERRTVAAPVSRAGLGAEYILASDAQRVLVQPLFVDETRLGVLLLEQRPGGAGFDQTALASLDQLATATAVALRHAELFTRSELDRAQLLALHDVTLSIGRSADLAATLQLITDAAARLTGSHRSRLGLRHGRWGYRLAAVTDDRDEVGDMYDLDETVGGWTIRTGEAAWLPDLAGGVAHPPEALRRARRPEGSAALVPLRRDDEVLGFLSLHDDRPGHLPRSVLGLLERFAAEAVLALDNDATGAARRELERRLRDQAEHDPLTGLANRGLLLDHLQAALDQVDGGAHVGLLYLDLDRFKTVNDSLGHAAGDELLVTVAQLLLGVVRPCDLICRLGGDEFVLVVPGLPHASEALELGERVLRLMGRPLTIAGATVFTSASIGVVTARDSGRSARQLLRDADIAMYQAKQTGRSRCAVFLPAMAVAATARLALETELRQALDAEVLTVAYQPIVSLPDGRLTGVEALVRWHHPVRGSVSPDEFIPIAEETGMVSRIDDAVLRQATAALRGWQLRFGRPDLEVSVNLSAVTLAQAGVGARVRAALAAAGLPPASLTLEVTETAAMQDNVATETALGALRD
ncbi:MAG: diguanylate cyclase, partial [Frankiales bacterium]|nr:diguanylate cyclase [Frankiales bacterium]